MSIVRRIAAVLVGLVMLFIAFALLNVFAGQTTNSEGVVQHHAISAPGGIIIALLVCVLGALFVKRLWSSGSGPHA